MGGAEVTKKFHKAGKIRDINPVARDLFLKNADAFMEFAKKANQVLMLSIRGISMLEGTPKLVHAIAKAEAVLGRQNEERQKQLKNAEATARLAQEEVKNGFPLLHAHTAIAIWSALESSLPRMASAWLLQAPDTLERGAFQKLRIPIALACNLTNDSLASLAIEELMKSQALSNSGIGRFEHVFEEVGLGGGVHATQRKILYEFSQVRNLIVHKNGVVDSKFRAACPWIKLKEGKSFIVTRKRYVRYRDSAIEYLTEIIDRYNEATSGKRVTRRPRRSRMKKLTT
jgi:hypothetical protein